MKKETKKIFLSSSKKEGLGNKRKYLWGISVLAIAVAGAVAIYSSSKTTGSLSTSPRVDEGVVVAVVGDEKVKMADLEALKNGIPQLKELPMEQVYEHLLEAYVNNQVILNAAKKAGVQNRPLVKKLLSDAEDQILFQAYLNEQLQAHMNQDVLEKIYQEEIKNYVPVDEVHARHILVGTEKEAKDLIVKLKNGANFEELANQYSLDKNPTAPNGGDLGYFKKEMIIPEFAKAAFALKTGRISQKPVKTSFGWHVIKVEDRRKAPVPTMVEMADVIKARFQEVMIPVILKQERDNAQVQLFDPLKLKEKTEKATLETEEKPIQK